MYSLLIVDDQPEVISSLKRVLSRDKYQLYFADNAKTALSILDKNVIDLVLSDQRMPQMPGNEFLAKVYQQYPQTIRMLLSGFSDNDAIIDSINHAHIHSFLKKPWDNDLLRKKIKAVLQEYEGALTCTRVQSESPGGLNCIATLDHYGCIISASKNFLNLFGYTENELSDQPLLKLLADELTSADSFEQLVTSMSSTRDKQLRVAFENAFGVVFIGILSIINMHPSSATENYNVSITPLISST